MERKYDFPLSLTPPDIPATKWEAIEGFRLENGVFTIILVRNICHYMYSPRLLKREYLTKQEFREKYGIHPRTYII